MNPTCYVLKLYTYDYFEVEETIAASFDQEKLKEKYRKISAEGSHLYSDAPLVDLTCRAHMSGSEKVHWYIEEIEML